MSTPDPRRWQALFILCLAQFFVIMDTSIIGVALPAIQQELSIQQHNLSWIFNSYVIVFGGLLLLGGRLADLFGPRRIFLLGFLVLTLASLLAGVASSETILNTARALQGAGAALIAPAAMTLLMQLFGARPQELGKAMGFWGASAAAGGSAGVFLGGVFTQYLSWEWVFLVNVPVGILVLLFSRGILPAGQRSRGSVDVPGALTVTLGLSSLVYGIVQAERGLSGLTLGALVLGVVLLLIFILLQASRKEPLMPLGLFSRPNLAVGNTINVLLAGSWIPLWFFLNLYLQQVLGLSALNSGLALLPMTLAIMALMVGVTGNLIGQFGVKANLTVGLVLLAGALLLLARAPVDGNFLIDVLPATLIAALGMSLAYIPATILSVSGAKPEEGGLASGVVNTTYQVGSAVGLAVIGLIAQANTSTGPEGLLSGFQAAFISAAVLAGLGAVITLTVAGQKQQGQVRA